jgi:hypothetical protein
VVSRWRQCGAEYVLGFGDVSYQVLQSVVYCSHTLRWSQDKEMGSCIIGDCVVACLASLSASSFPAISVCLGTCDPGHSFCCTEDFSIVRFPFVIRR